MICYLYLKVTRDQFSKYETLKFTSLDQLHHLVVNFLSAENKRCLVTSMTSSCVKCTQ